MGKHPLAILRESRGWTQNDLGAVLGVSGARVGAVEGNTVPRAWIEHLTGIGVVPDAQVFESEVNAWVDAHVNELVKK